MRNFFFILKSLCGGKSANTPPTRFSHASHGIIPAFFKPLALVLLFVFAGLGNVWGGTTYEQLTSIASIDENAEYVLGIDGTGFHYEGTSSWGKTALPSAHTPIKYTLKKASDGESFTAEATIDNTKYYLQVPTSNTFSMATSKGTNTDLIIGTTQVSETNYAVANQTTTARHLRINSTSGLRSYAGTTGTMAFFYKVVSASPCTITWHVNGSTTTEGNPTTNSSTGSQVTKLPTSPISSDCDGSKVFVGWTATEIVGTTNTKPADLFTTAAESPALTGNTDFYAVFANASEGAPTWQKTTSIAVGDVVVFVNETNKYEMTGVSSNLGQATSYTSVQGTYPLTIVAGSTNGSFSFKNGSNYLSYSGSSNQLKTSADKDATSSWTISSSTNGNFKLANVNTTARILQYNHNNGSPRWACYGNSNQAAFQIYKQTVSINYSNYATSCCTPLAQVEGSVNVSQTTATSATVSWTIPVDDSSNKKAAGVILHLYADNNNAKGSEITSKSADYSSDNTTTTHTFDGLAPATKYWFTIELIGQEAGGVTYCNSGEGDAVSFTTGAASTTWSITYNANADGVTNMPTTTYAEKSTGEGTLSATIPVRPGYTFLGWDKIDDATSATYEAGAGITGVDDDLDLYAIWEQRLVTLDAGNGSVTGSPLTPNAQGKVTLPAATPSAACATLGWEFVGWAEAEATGDKPAAIIAAGEYEPSAKTKLYAVYGELGNTYTKITTAAEFTTGNYVFATAAGNALNNTISNKQTAGTDVTVTSGTSISNPAEAAIWFVTKSNSNYTLYNAATEGTNKYLNIIADNNYGQLASESTGAAYTVSFDAGAIILTSVSCSPQQIEYHNGVFKSWNGQSVAIYTFKQDYDSYKTSPNCTAYTLSSAITPAASGEVELGKSSLITDATTTATASPTEGYRFLHWTISGTGASMSNTEEGKSTDNPVTITMGSEDATITAHFEAIPTYNIEFSINGAKVEALKLADQLEGTAIVFPDAAAITTAGAFPTTDKKFVGWIEESSYASDEAPTFVTSATATADKTYYAVFADVIGDNVVDEYNNDLEFPFALWEKTNSRGQKSDGEAWAMFGAKNINPEGEINSGSAYSNLVSLGFNAKTGSNNTTLTIYYSADKSVWTELTTKDISQNTTYSDYSIDLSAIPAGAKYIKVKNSTNSFYIKSITLTQGAISDYVTNISPLSSIAITAAPTKTVYKKGELLNLENMVITATYENSRTRPVTNYTVTPSTTTALATTDESFTVSYTEGETTKTATQNIHVYELSGIAITAPTKTTYNAGETFDPAGMTVTATWGGSVLDKIVESVDGYTYSPETAFTNETDEDIHVDVTISYTHEGVTKTATQEVTVRPLASLTMTWNVAGETTTSKIYINNEEKYLLALPSDPDVPEAFGAGYEFIGWTSDATIAKDGQGINWAANNDVMAVATEFKAVFAQVNAPFFKETFDGCEGTGGNDDRWSGTIASSTVNTDNNGWTNVSAGGAYQCIRLGAGGTKGSAETPSFSLTGSATLTFKAGAWNGNSEGTTLNISATGATLKQNDAAISSVTLTKGAWTTYSIDVTEATGTVKIKFEAKNASNNRFFLDEVMIKQGDEDYKDYRFVPSNVARPEIELAEATYYGAQNATITQSQGKQIFYSLDGNTWTEYTAPVALDQAGEVTLSAKAYDSDEDDYSSVVSKSYTIVTEIDAPTMTASCVFVDEQTVTISHDMSGTEGFALQYSYDGENYTDYTEALTLTETATIYAKATIGSLEATANATYTKGYPVEYNKVTSADGLAIGQQFIIKASSANSAAGALSDNILASVDIPAEVSNIITLINEPVTVFELGGRSGAYTLISDGKYLKYKSNKELEYSTTVADTWTITYSAGTPTIKNVTNSSYSLQYNSSSPRFTVYSSNQTDVAIYAKEAIVYTLTIKNYDGSDKTTDKVVEGSSFILTEADAPTDYPANYAFLNKWTDGENTYAVGDEVVVSAAKTLEPCWKVTPTANVDINALPATVTEIVVTEGKELTVGENRTLDNLTIEAGGKVKTTNELTVINNLTIESETGKSGQVMDATKVNAANIYMDVNFYKPAATLDATTANQWYMISAPFNVNLNGGFLQTNGTPMVFGTDFDLFEYDGAKRANTGVTGWKRVSGQMKAGTACLIGFNEGQATTIRLKAANTAIGEATSITLNAYDGDADNQNWNGVANPNLHYISLNKDVQYYDNVARGYNPGSKTGTSYVVGTAFFIQESGEATISNTVNTTLQAPRRAAQSQELEFCVRLAKEDANWANHIYIRASEDASAQYEQGHDMVTWNGTTAKTALLWTENYGTRLAIEEAPLLNNQASYALGLYVPANGTYRIDVANTQTDATLYLTQGGTIIWNLTDGAYEVDLTAGTTSEYGLLLQAGATQIPTGVEEVGASKAAQKVVIDDHVYILRGEKMYDTTGKVVK